MQNREEKRSEGQAFESQEEKEKAERWKRRKQVREPPQSLSPAFAHV